MSKPLVSVGVPVYNAECYLRLALDSLLAQDYENFELLISDNASTDKTEEICREYSARDSRIRYFRNETNIGGPKNFGRLLELSSGKYFMWSAHDDLRAPTYLSECVSALESNPSAVCCFTSVVFIDEDGKTVEPGYEQGHPRFGLLEHNRRKRVRYLLAHAGWYSFYSLMRTEALRKCGPLQNLLGLDLALLFELSLMGPMIKIPKALFFYRVFPNLKTVESIMESVDTSNRGKPIRPYTDILRALLGTLRKAHIGGFNKSALFFEVVFNYCFRNAQTRSMLGAESLKETTRAYREGDYKGAALSAPLCLLTIPDKLYHLRVSTEERLMSSYQRRDLWTFTRSLPLYIILTPGNLFRPEAWAAIGKLFRRHGAMVK